MQFFSSNTFLPCKATLLNFDESIGKLSDSGKQAVNRNSKAPTSANRNMSRNIARPPELITTTICLFIDLLKFFERKGCDLLNDLSTKTLPKIACFAICYKFLKISRLCFCTKKEQAFLPNVFPKNEKAETALSRKWETRPHSNEHAFTCRWFRCRARTCCGTMTTGSAPKAGRSPFCRDRPAPASSKFASARNP